MAWPGPWFQTWVGGVETSISLVSDGRWVTWRETAAESQTGTWAPGCSRKPPRARREWGTNKLQFCPVSVRILQRKTGSSSWVTSHLLQKFSYGELQNFSHPLFNMFPNGHSRKEQLANSRIFPPHHFPKLLYISKRSSLHYWLLTNESDLHFTSIFEFHIHCISHQDIMFIR